MQFPTTVLALSLLLTSNPFSLTSAQESSFYDLSLYSDSACSISEGGLDGSGSKNCTILPTTSSSSSYSPPELYMQASFAGSCVINFYSDSCCADQVSGTTSPPNLGCVSAGKSTYYDVTC